MAKNSKQTRYPSPGPVGGKLIREVIRTLREAGLKLPITSDIQIAISSGSDSMALAHLLIHYGRRVGDRSRIKLLHINHGWRGKSSDADAVFVRVAAKRWGVSCRVVRAVPPGGKNGESWEDHARKIRKREFARAVAKTNCRIFTAHQAEDLAETVLWRLFTGSVETHGGGIAVQSGCEVRPLLRIRKQMLKEYLKEAGELWREDSSNQDSRFLRVRIRKELLPLIEEIFPKAVDHLVSMALNAQRRDKEARGEKMPDENSVLLAVVAASGLSLRKNQWVNLTHQFRSAKPRTEVSLPGGWLFRKEKKRWILEKTTC